MPQILFMKMWHCSYLKTLAFCTFLKLVEEKLSFNSFSKENYKTVSTEKFGLLPFSKYIEKPSAGNFEKKHGWGLIGKLE
jgi:hypothetical protein